MKMYPCKICGGRARWKMNKFFEVRIECRRCGVHTSNIHHEDGEDNLRIAINCWNNPEPIHINKNEIIDMISMPNIIVKWFDPRYEGPAVLIKKSPQ